MRILFSSRPAFGHVFAIAPLAAAARSLGHDVVFASGEEFLPQLRSWGFESRKVGDAIESGFQRAAATYPELLQPERPEFGARMFVDILGPSSLHDMAALIEEMRPALVVYEATDVGAGVAAAAAGIPVACHSLSVWTSVFVDAMRDRMQILWEQARAEPTVDIALGDAFLDIWPPSMQSEEAPNASDQHWSLRPITWSDSSADVPDWIKAADGPLVFVSFGTIFWGKELLAKVMEGLAEIDCDALVLASVDVTPDDFSIKSDRLRVSGFVNQAEVLRHTDLVIHHGGAGTMLGTLTQGLPSLVLAEGADRPYTARSLEASGAGIALEPATATAQDIAEALATLLNDGRYRERANEIKGEIENMPMPDHVVERLQLLATGR